MRIQRYLECQVRWIRGIEERLDRLWTTPVDPHLPARVRPYIRNHLDFFVFPLVAPLNRPNRLAVRLVHTNRRVVYFDAARGVFMKPMTTPRVTEQVSLINKTTYTSTQYSSRPLNAAPCFAMALLTISAPLTTPVGARGWSRCGASKRLRNIAGISARAKDMDTKSGVYAYRVSVQNCVW